MRYSQLFGKTLRQAPKEAEAISHQLLTRGGFIDHQLTAGVYSYLPLGWRVYKKIENIIREEMNAIGGQEVFLPTLQPKELWMRSDRWDHMDPPLFKFKDRHEKELTIAPTHEEVITDLASRMITSYRDLPLAVYQIQNKFRNEMRATGGLLRVREFMMKDLYSFHTTPEDLDRFYLEVIEAYKNIFSRCGFHAKIVQANSGTIGGNESHEFMMVCQTGEDTIVCCRTCDWASNVEKSNPDRCPKCGSEIERVYAIESGHAFKLGTKYSELMRAYFTNQSGQKKPLVMGCYGIGLGRLMATVVEEYHDEKGIIWPKTLAPFLVHLVDLGLKERGGEIYKTLTKFGIDVLWDDRTVSAGEKFADADLIGIPVRLLVSEKTGDKVEMKRRDEQNSEFLSLEEVVNRLRSF